MRLKKIRLFGFKSFADRVVLDFHPGITVIVGPNGCGKSNISDGFRWVLGEQSAKSLRGHKMQDVIFAGTTNRKPLNIAEVSITLTDIQGSLPIEFDELEITRRLHRSGESEYLLNNTDVRLKDIHALFYDSGIGKEAFSIFEQGKIDQVIHYSPLERRSIFEEAAGIVRFLHRKREALRKLEQTDQNLSRVEDILREVNQRIAVLEEQAEKARKVKELKGQTEQLEKQLMITKWSQSRQKHKQLSHNHQNFHQQTEDQSKESQQLRHALHQARILAHECEQAWKARSAEMYAKRNERDLHLRDKSHAAQRREELQTQIVHGEKEWKNLQAKVKEQEEEHANLLDSLGELKEQSNAKYQEFGKAQKQLDELNTKLEELRAEQEQKQQSRLLMTQQHSQKIGDLKQTQARLESILERCEELEEKSKQLEIEKKEAQEKVDARSEELKEISKAIDQAKAKLEQTEIKSQELKEQLSQSKTNQECYLKEAAALRARQHALQELRDAMEGFSPSCRHLIELNQDASNPFYGKLKPLYEWISGTKAHPKACAVMLQPYNHALVVEQAATRDAVLKYAKTHGLVDFELICIEDIKDKKITEHFLGNLLEAKSLKEAFQLLNKNPQAQVWVEEGYLIDNARVLFYQPKGDGSAFIREAEIEELETKAILAEKKKNEEEKNEARLQAAYQEVTAQKAVLDREMRTTEMKHVEINYSMLRYQGDVKRIQSDLSQLLEEKNRLQLNQKELSERQALLQNETSALEKKLNHSANAAQEQQAYLEEASLSVKRSHLQWEQHQKAWEQAKVAERQQSHAIELLAVKMQETVQRMQKIRGDIGIAQSALEAVFDNTEDSSEQIEALQKSLEKLEAACQQLEQKSAEAKETIAELDEKIQKNEALLKSSETEKNKLYLQISQLETLQEALSQAYFEKYETALDESQVSEFDLLNDIQAGERQLKALRQELESLQNVNMMAIEECEKDKTRSTFLTGQVGDLVGSKDELIKVIAELDGQSRKLFKETFVAVRANFQKNFAILFNGGEADLQFVEDGDILEAGIEITAKPPGKQMRSISLLSGGEKCLTAMALLFAIFEVKPAPYCILDEIDAPLDDTNVERFLNVVRQFVDRCQFIIITHNKRTMALADRLYGVSMQEKGVSKLLSMEFSNEIKAAPVLSN